MASKKPLIVAITGGIGCGQTTVANYMGQLGARVIQADAIAKEVVDKDRAVREELRRAFGRKIFYPNGKINRKLLARIAFSDELKTHRLNKIVHPQMVARIIDEIEKARDSRKYPVIVIDAALVYELNLEHHFDAIVVVTSKMGNRIKRIKDRDGLSEREVIDRINKQLPIEDKMKWADFVIENNGTLEELQQKTAQVYQRLMKFKTPTSRRSGRKIKK